MRKQNHSIGQRYMAYILLFSLFLQNCTNPSLSLGPNKQGPIKKNQLQASMPMERSVQAKVASPDLQELIHRKEELKHELDPSLQGTRPTADQSDKPNTLSPLADQQAKTNNLQPIHLSPDESSFKLTRNKSTLNSLQVHKQLGEGQQVKPSSTSLLLEKAAQRTKQVDKGASAAQGVVSLKPGAFYNKPLVTKGRYQIAFEKTSGGLCKATVSEFFQVGISRRMEWPVFFQLGYNLGHVVDSHVVHMAHQDGRNFIWVGAVGLRGGMYQGEQDDNNNKSNSNSSKVEMVPIELSAKLKYLYQQDDTLPQLIEGEDIPAQRIQDYYVKLQVVLQGNLDQERSAATRDQVVGEKKPLELEKLFDKIDQKNPAVGKVLLLGGAGIGKTTLMHYISHQWAHGKLWKDKYEHVFRVRLKELLDPTWSKKADKPDLLARFIYSCLDKQKTALAAKRNNQIRETVYNLHEIQQLLKNPSKKEKVLLLVDGYDEITSLQGKPEYQQIVDLGVFQHPQVILTSRPHAASKEIRAKFARQIESQGLDEAGINHYINLQFKQEPALGEELKNFLFSNSQVRSMCEVPINTALLCTTWKDPATRAKLVSSTSIRTDFKLGQVYQELVVWLGKRYAIKYNPGYQGSKVLEELSNEEAVVEEKVFKALERIAYQTFTGVGLENQARQEGTFSISGQLVDQLVRKESKELDLLQLQQYGLLKGEGDPNKPLEQVYYFIHLTFQEYLTAHCLCKLLSQEDQVKEAATWLAHHRNEPKYLMTLKFLAGLVSQSKDDRIVRRFWEAMSCNIDGVIELGVAGKVKLFMHLLSQSKIGGGFDKRIPNILQIEKLVDSTLQGDLVKWQQDVIEAGYFPTCLQEAARKELENGVELAKKASLSEENRMRLQVAANLLSKMVSQGGTLSREQLFTHFIRLTQLQNSQLQKLGLEAAREVVNQTVPAHKLKEGAKNIVHLLLDQNLEKAATELFAKLGQIAPPVFEYLSPWLTNTGWLVRLRAIDALRGIVQSVPGLGKEVLNALKPLLADSHEFVRKNAIDALRGIVQSVPGLGKEALNALKPLLADSHEFVRKDANEVLKLIIKLVPGLGEEVFEALKSLLTDKNYDVQIIVASGLKDMVKSFPELGKKGLDALKPLLATRNEIIRTTAAETLGAIVQAVPGLGKEGLEALKPLLTTKNEGVGGIFANTLGAIVQAVPELGGEVVKILEPLVTDSNERVRSNAAYFFSEVVQAVPELGEEVFKVLKPLVKDSNERVRSSAVYSFSKVVQSVPKLGEEVFKVLEPLVTDSNERVRSKAAYFFSEVVQSVPRLRKEGLDALKPLLADSNEGVRSSAADALLKIVQLAPFNELALLSDSNQTVRRAVKKVLIDKFKLVEKIGYQDIPSLMKVLKSYQSAKTELEKALYVAANEALQQLAGVLDRTGIQWLNQHFTELPTLPVVQTFLKAVIYHALEDGIIDLQVGKLLIKCIVERGFTATINAQANQIVLEDNTYTLQPASQANLNYVANEVIRLAKDPMAQQYKDHKPLFKNSGKGLSLATADIEKAVSILDKTPLGSDSWHVSVLDLSDNQQNKPSTTFILLEQRNYAGQHVIHQLQLDQGEGKVSSRAINPLAVDQIRQELLGQFYSVSDSSYYGYSFKLSQRLVEKLLETAKQIKHEENAYDVFHKLAGDYQALQDNQKRKDKDLLSLPWEEYSNHPEPAVKKYKKEQLYEQEMESAETNVNVNLENMGNL